MAALRCYSPRAVYHSPFTIYYSPAMIIARILGTVVSTQKDERLMGKKLLIVRPLNLDGTDGSGYVVAVDTVGAGFRERVLVVSGSSARLAQGMKDTPVDAAIIGVIDTVDVVDD